MSSPGSLEWVTQIVAPKSIYSYVDGSRPSLVTACGLPQRLAEVSRGASLGKSIDGGQDIGARFAEPMAQEPARLCSDLVPGKGPVAIAAGATRGGDQDHTVTQHHANLRRPTAGVSRVKRRVVHHPNQLGNTPHLW